MNVYCAINVFFACLGYALCHAICEHFIAKVPRAFVLFATHFLDLSKLDLLYPNVINYHFAVEAIRSKEGDPAATSLAATHRLTRGEKNIKI